MTASLDMDSPILNGYTISTRDTDVDEIMEQLQFTEAIESIEVEEIGSSMKYIGNTDNFKKNVRENEKIFGGDIECLVAELDIDGEDYLLFADLIKYEDKWYVLRTNGFAGMFIGLTATSGGIVPVSALE
jgi:hypothetical protein